MVSILAKWFIKNHEDYKDTKVRENYGVLCGAVGIFLNVLLFAGKFLAGLLSHSIAITADAFNNLSDAGSSVVSMIGFKLAGQKPDSEHPFGHGRMEYISGMVISVFIFLMGYELIKSSIDKIIHPELIDFNLVVLIILIVSVLVKIYMAFYNSAIGKKISSASMSATAKDSISDTIATSVVLISSLVSFYFKLPIDGYLGLIVGLMIIWAGYGALKDTLGPLLGQPAEKEFVDEIEEIVLGFDKILGIHDLVVHDYGPGRCMISLHAEVSYKENILELHDVIDQAEVMLRLKLNCEAVIHMDPIVDDDPVINEAKSKMAEIIAEMGGGLKFHDFRMVTGNTHSNLIFDVVVPFNNKNSDDEIRRQIQSKVTEYNPKYFTVIQIDRSYVQD